MIPLPKNFPPLDPQKTVLPNCLDPPLEWVGELIFESLNESLPQQVLQQQPTEPSLEWGAPRHYDIGRSILKPFMFVGPREKLELGSQVGKHNWNSYLSCILVLAHEVGCAECFGQRKVCLNLESRQSLGQYIRSRTQLHRRLLVKPFRPVVSHPCSLNPLLCTFLTSSHECAGSLSRVWLFATPGTVAHQAPLSMGFPSPGYWGGLPFPSPGLISVALQYFSISLYLLWGLPQWLIGKESACNARDGGSIPGSGRASREGSGNPLQYSCLENPMDRGSLVGYTPWGRRIRHDSDWAQVHTHNSCTFTLQINSSLLPQPHPTWSINSWVWCNVIAMWLK